MIHLNVSNYGERFYPQRPAQRADERLRVRLLVFANFSGYPDAKVTPPALSYSATVTQKTEHTEVLRLAGVYCLFAAGAPVAHLGNLHNGGRQEDTILSGIMSLASSNIAVAAVVLSPAFLVPFTKVIVMFTLPLSIHFKCQQGPRTRISLRLVTWIGRCLDADLLSR